MGFTKKTWLALALAIVLVLGLGATALAAAPDAIAFNTSDTYLVVGGSAGSLTVAGTVGGNAADKANVAVTALPTGIVTFTSPAQTDTAFSLTPAKPGATVLTAKSAGLTDATANVFVNPSEITITGITTAAITMKTGRPNVTQSFGVTGNGTVLTSAASAAAGKVSASSSDDTIASVTNTTDGFKITSNKAGVAKITVTYTNYAASAPGTLTKEITVNVVPGDLQTATESGKVEDFYNSTTGGATLGAYAFRVEGQMGNNAGWQKLLNKVGSPEVEVLTIVQNPANSVTITAASASANPDYTIFSVAPISTFAGKVTLTPTYKVGDVTVTGEAITIDVLDPTKVQSFALELKANTTAGLAASATKLDPAKDANQTLDYKAGDNVYLFTIPVDAIVPDSANVVADLKTPNFKPAKLKWESTSKNVKITTPVVATTGSVETGDKQVQLANATALECNQALIQFTATGKATIKVTVDNYTRTLVFNVTNAKASAFEVPAMNLVVGQYKKVAATATPVDARLSLTYKSNKKSVATVTSAGVVKGVKAGSAKITVKDKISGVSKSFTVTVGKDYSKINVAGFSLYTSEPAATAANIDNRNNSYDLAALVYSGTFNGNYHEDSNRWGESTGWYASSSSTTIKKDFLADLLNAALEDKPATGAVTGKLYASDDDIFYFTFMGDVDANGNIVLKPAAGADAAVTVSFDEIITQLTKIKGTIVMVLDCNMSSTVLTSKSAGAVQTPAQMNQLIINKVAQKNALVSKSLSSATAAADSYKQKFKVITSTSKKAQKAHSTTWTQTETELDGNTNAYVTSTDNTREFWLSKYVYAGINPGSNYMPADKNKNKLITMKEMYSYLNGKMKAEVARYNKGKSKSDRISQSIAVYPSKTDAFPIYGRMVTASVDN